jgi:hypothetical protein
VKWLNDIIDHSRLLQQNRRKAAVPDIVAAGAACYEIAAISA